MNTWIYIAIALLGLVSGFFIGYFVRRSDDGLAVKVQNLEEIVARRRLPYVVSDGLLDGTAVVRFIRRLDDQYRENREMLLEHLDGILVDLQNGDYDPEKPGIKGRLDG